MAPRGATAGFRGVACPPKPKGVFVRWDKSVPSTALGVPADAMFGSMFGKDASYLVVVGKAGLQESKDGGKTWRPAAPLPAVFIAGRVVALFPVDLLVWKPGKFSPLQSFNQEVLARGKVMYEC